jgi:hypothetical protein
VFSLQNECDSSSRRSRLATADSNLAEASLPAETRAQLKYFVEAKQKYVPFVTQFQANLRDQRPVSPVENPRRSDEPLTLPKSRPVSLNSAV